MTETSTMSTGLKLTCQTLSETNKKILSMHKNLLNVHSCQAYMNLMKILYLVWNI